MTHRNGCCHEIVDMYKATEVDAVAIASEKTRQFIIELTKINMAEKVHLNRMFTVWMQFIRDPTTIPAEFLDYPEVKEAMSTLTIMSADKAMRGEYYARLRQLNDMRANKTIGFKEGLAEGLEQGRAEERAKAEKEKRQFAKKMLLKGLSVSDVADFTGLSVEEVEALA